jgi:hypothetical protein
MPKKTKGGSKKGGSVASENLTASSVSKDGVRDSSSSSTTNAIETTSPSSLSSTQLSTSSIQRRRRQKERQQEWTKQSSAFSTVSDTQQPSSPSNNKRIIKKKKKTSMTAKHQNDSKSGGMDALIPSLIGVVLLGVIIMAKMGFRGRATVAGIDLGTTNSVICVQAPSKGGEC